MGVSDIIKKLKDEFNSYSKKIKITIVVLSIFVLAFVIFSLQILLFGLGYTGMNNTFAFGVWIILDLGLVALGGGAFTIGFVLYILRNDKLQPIINSTVLLGFLCYLFTFIFLALDVGQPLRAWFGYIYPNWGPNLMPQSMLTEVFWCLTLYFGVLCFELVPVVLKHKFLDKYPIINAVGHYMHKIMWIMAAAGTFLSFFHQGSLGGGMWGVLYAKPAWFRPHFFFMVIVAATAGGTSFMLLCAYLAGKVMKKEVVPASTFHSLARISGIMFIFYFTFRIYDTYMMSSHFVPLADRQFIDLWGGYYGIWMHVLELLGCLIAIAMLNFRVFREKEKTMLIGVAGGVAGIFMSKIVVLIHGLSVPNFPWRDFAIYSPSIQEWLILLGGLSAMALIYMWCVKYLPIFPHLEKVEHSE